MYMRRVDLQGVFGYIIFYFTSILIVFVVFVLLAVQDGHGEVLATPCTGTYLVIPFGLWSSAERAGSRNWGVTCWYQRIWLPRVADDSRDLRPGDQGSLGVRISLDAYFRLFMFSTFCVFHDSLDSRIVPRTQFWRGT